MAQQLTALVNLAKDLGSVTSIQIFLRLGRKPSVKCLLNKPKVTNSIPRTHMEIQAWQHAYETTMLRKVGGCLGAIG